MTRVALIASSYLPRRGGVEEHVDHVARELAARGREVEVWTVEVGRASTRVHDGVRVRELPCPLPSRSVRDIARWLWSAPAAAWAWWRAIRAFRPDILNIQCFGPNGVWASVFARLTRTPLVYSNHGETFMDAYGSFGDSALLRASLRSTLARSAAVTSCSRYAADDLTLYGPPRSVEVVGNAVDLDVIPQEIGGLPERYLVAVGRLVENKGFNQLLEAFADTASDPALEGVDLVIAGDGPDAAWLRRYARELDIEDRVHFTGSLSRDRIAAVLAGGLVQVVPSHIEAFGIVILEGWRAGVPVIATSHGGPPEFVAHDVDGLLCDPWDTEGLGTALAELVADPPRRTRLADAARERLPDFTWTAVADRYDEVFTKLTSTTPMHSEAPR